MGIVQAVQPPPVPVQAVQEGPQQQQPVQPPPVPVQAVQEGLLAQQQQPVQGQPVQGQPVQGGLLQEGLQPQQQQLLLETFGVAEVHDREANYHKLVDTHQPLVSNSFEKHDMIKTLFKSHGLDFLDHLSRFTGEGVPLIDHF